MGTEMMIVDSNENLNQIEQNQTDHTYIPPPPPPIPNNEYLSNYQPITTEEDLIELQNEQLIHFQQQQQQQHQQQQLMNNYHGYVNFQPFQQYSAASTHYPGQQFNNEMFHYQNSNYMNWTVPFYVAKQPQNTYVPLTTNVDHLHSSNIVVSPIPKKSGEEEELNEHDEYQNSMDFAMALLIFVLGFFIYIPWFFGVFFLKSKSVYARRLSKLSIFLAIFGIVMFALGAVVLDL